MASLTPVSWEKYQAAYPFINYTGDTIVSIFPYKLSEFHHISLDVYIYIFVFVYNMGKTTLP